MKPGFDHPAGNFSVPLRITLTSLEADDVSVYIDIYGFTYKIRPESRNMIIPGNN